MQKKNLIQIILLISAIFISNSILALNLKQKITNPNNILIGDIIKYKIIISDIDNEIINVKTNDFSPFELVKKSQKTINKNSIEYLFELSIYETGKQEIPEIKFSITKDKKEHEVVASSKSIIVKSVLKKNDDQNLLIKDIKETISVKEKSYFIVYLISGFIILFILLVLLKRWKNKEKIIPIIIEKKLPAHEIAYKKLSELINLDLIKKGKIKEYFFVLSEVIREFIGNRYNFDSIELTSGELISHIKLESTFNREYLIVINNFLDDSDLIKFSKIEPTTEEIEKITKLAFKIVDDLKIKIMD